MYKSKQKDVFRSKYIFLLINEHGKQQNVGAATSYEKETPVEAPGHPSNSGGDLGKVALSRTNATLDTQYDLKK